MAIANRFEELYFIGGKSFDEVIKAFDDAGKVGAEHGEYWLSRARFYAKGKMSELAKGEIEQLDQGKVIEQYTLLMYTAQKHDNANKAKIAAEKDDTINKINKTFEQEGKIDRKASRLTSGLLAIPFVILLLVFHLDDRTIDPNIYQADSNGRDWPTIPVVVSATNGRERSWPLEDIERLEEYLVDVSIDNWTFDGTQYSSFLEMGYLAEFMAVGPTRDEVENMGMQLYEGHDTLVADNGDGEHSVQFRFDDDEEPETVTTVALLDVRYFDGLALYELAGYNIQDIAAIFALNYDVSVSYWYDGMISFTYEEVVFEISEFSSTGATVSVGSPH